MASSSQYVSRFDKLNGENYRLWKVNIKKTLEEKELWQHVTGEAILPDNHTPEAEERFWIKENEALEIIADGVEPKHQIHIQDCDKASEAWKALQRIFEKKPRAGILQLKKQIKSIKLEKNETMKSYLKRLMICSDNFKEIQYEFNDDDFVYAMLSGLPDTYNEIVMKLTNLDDENFNPTKIKDILMDEYEILEKKSETEKQSNEAFQQLAEEKHNEYKHNLKKRGETDEQSKEGYHQTTGEEHSDWDEFAKIIIDKKQITFTTSLGNGAFGEVYKGTVKNFKNSGTTVDVAIKMLPIYASSREKKEMLEEAKLMIDFDHIHVLKLLGICFNVDSPWLILELMEEGDLLTYLKESRLLQPEDPHALRRQDLIDMCEDVARGCRYLEEQHFVHRDLACRNCLISTRDREHRIVKVSDFGLSRDIYINDYYRMEGEDPLPIRWMAPESLAKNIFTSQSDVWAFGVLMWEITSLGWKPYAALFNHEVFKQVCAGKTSALLLKPRNCPELLYDLMLRCWNMDTTLRPKFIHCLNIIEILKADLQDDFLENNFKRI